MSIKKKVPPRRGAKKALAKALSGRRLFVAIQISGQLAPRITTWRNTRGKSLALPLRWVDERDYHITLVPPWVARDDEDVRAAEAALTRAAAATPPFTIDFRRISQGPNHKAPNVLWLEGVSDARADSARERLFTALKVEDDDVWRPHVTIARMRGKGSSGTRENIETPFPWTEHVREIALLESPREGAGGGYKTLCTAPLARAR